MKLLLDIGNTRLKWALADGDRFDDGGARVHAGHPEDCLDALPVDDPDAVWVCSVMDAATRTRLQQALRLRWPCPPQFATSSAECDGLRSAYAEPHRLGVDRWMAMLGAWAQTRGACVVADAGTALTVDVIDAGGRHLGGLIAAGLQTSRAAVLGATRFDAAATVPTPHAGLGTDTESCVDQGALLSCLGAIDRATATAPAGAPRFLTGGDAPRLLPHLGPDWNLQPDLVLRGLLHRADRD